MRLFALAAALCLSAPAAISMTADELAELSASADASMARIQQADMDRRHDVRARALAACQRLWETDEDAAILNPVCFDVFTGNGLPN